MEVDLFRTVDGRPVTAVTADEMRDVDRVAVEEVGIDLLQMMENAGRNLAGVVREELDGSDGGRVAVLAGDGGNGGGGLACARHLANHGVPVTVVLDRKPAELAGVTARQHAILDAMDVSVGVGPDALATGAAVIVDALVGYGLRGPLRGAAAALVERVADHETVVSLDVPTGRNATTGAEPGVVIDPARVLTLALPKTGLAGLGAPVTLADIAIPAVVYKRLSLPYDGPFTGDYRVDLVEA